MGSSLATNEIENGAFRSIVVSFIGHFLLALLIFFLPGRRHKIFIEDIPRSVKLIATLQVPPTPPAPKRISRPKPKPKVVKPAPIPPKPVKSKVQIPTRKAPEKAPEIVKSTQPAPSPAPSALRDKLADRLASLDRGPSEIAPPEVTVPSIAPVAVPNQPQLPAMADRSRELVPLSDFPFSWYITLVKNRVYSHWSPPSSFILGGKKVRAIATFTIAHNGSIRKVALEESSGHHLFDQSVLAALTTVGALPSLPEDYKEDHLDVVIRFQNPNN